MTDNEYRKIYDNDPYKAQTALFYEYFNYVYAIVYNKLRSCGSREDIEECVEDVFSAVFISYDRDRNFNGDMKGFIAVIANRTAVQMYRRLLRSKESFYSENEAAEIADTECIEENAERSALKNTLLKLIKSLGEPDSGINTIEDIGTEKMSVDKKEMDRILKNTMKKYEKQKREQGIIPHTAANNDEAADSVSGVEVHDRRNISHIVYVALCSAAAVALIVGSIAMLSRNKMTTPDIHDPMVEVTTTVSSVAETTSLGAAAVIVTKTGTAATEITSSAASSTTTAEVSADNVTPPDDDNTADWKTAYRKALYDFMESEIYSGNMSTWDLQDIDNDGIPELLISAAQYHITGVMFYYYEDGKAVPVLGDDGQPMEYGFYGGVLISPEESLLGVDDVRQGMHYNVMHKYEDHRFTLVQRLSEDSGAVGKENASYTLNDEAVSEAEYNSAYNEVISKNWKAAGNQYTFDDFSALD